MTSTDSTPTIKDLRALVQATRENPSLAILDVVDALLDTFEQFSLAALYQAQGSLLALDRLDALTLRLHGDPDSGGTDGGEVGRLQRDVEHLMGYAVVTPAARVTFDEEYHGDPT